MQVNTWCNAHGAHNPQGHVCSCLDAKEENVKTKTPAFRTNDQISQRSPVQRSVAPSGRPVAHRRRGRQIVSEPAHGANSSRANSSKPRVSGVGQWSLSIVIWGPPSYGEGIPGDRLSRCLQHGSGGGPLRTPPTHGDESVQDYAPKPEPIRCGGRMRWV